ncbi:hypothetical protein E0700_06820 [Lactobacillus helveticus]|nr:hypothetical protein [Lactobacillus helveticus]MBW8037908.1 hypothetical protein [Lactobacillus helveticus]
MNSYQTNYTRKKLLFLMFLKINLRNHSSLHKPFYSVNSSLVIGSKSISFITFHSFLMIYVLN